MPVMMQMFSQHLSLPPHSAAAIAAELLQAPCDDISPKTAADASLLTQLHVQLLTLVSLASC